jgi:hypothetical protein
VKQTFTLAHDEARQRALRAVQTAPDGYMVTVCEPKRNLEQNALLWALADEIAKVKFWAGVRLHAEDWVRLLTAAWCRERGGRLTVIPSLDGRGFDVLYQRTSTLTKAEMSELIDYTQAWWSEQPESQQ